MIAGLRLFLQKSHDLPGYLGADLTQVFFCTWTGTRGSSKMRQHGTQVY
jgi:hypothetical protein